MAKKKRKKWEESAAKHIDKFIDRISLSELLQGAAILGGTYLMFTTVKELQQKEPFKFAGHVASSIETLLLGEPLAPSPYVGISPKSNLQWLVLSFLSSYVVVTKAPELIDIGTKLGTLAFGAVK